MTMNEEEKEILHYHKVTFRRDGREILKGVNWHVTSEERWALLGLNGAGKSTLLSMIMAYRMPTTGTVRVLGNEFGKCPWEGVKRRVGFVSSTLTDFQSTLDYQTAMTVVISGRFGSIGVYEEIPQNVQDEALALMEQFGLLSLKDFRFVTLSAGEQRRCLLVRAIMAKPDLLILDEPCNGLDFPAREYFLQAVTQLSIENHTPFIYVSHQIEEILPEITHVALLEDGVIVYKGEKKEILRDDILSDLYSMPVHVEWKKNRPWITIA